MTTQKRTSEDQVLANRAELAASVAPVSGDGAEAMRRATRHAERRTIQLIQDQPPPNGHAGRRALAHAGRVAVAGAIDTCHGGGRLTDDQAAWLTVLLRDLEVRDDAWSRMYPEHRQANRRLWTDLTRRAQPGYIAAPATLLAFVAWQSDNGALANVALDRALADDPTYSMADLLRKAINAGAPPSVARLPMSPEQIADSYDALGEEPVLRPVAPQGPTRRWRPGNRRARPGLMPRPGHPGQDSPGRIHAEPAGV
jgi:hypothetical protein